MTTHNPITLQSPSLSPSSSAVAMASLENRKPLASMAVVATSLAADKKADEKLDLAPFIQPHVMETLLTYFVKASRKVGVPNEIFNQSDVDRILNFCKLLKVNLKGTTVYGEYDFGKKYLGQKGLFDLIADIRNDFCKKKTPWQWTTHPFIEALDQAKIVLQKHIDGYWPYLASDAKLTQIDAKYDKTTAIFLFPEHFIEKQQKIFEQANEQLGQNLQDGLLLQPEIDAILNLMRTLSISNDGKVTGSLTYNNAEFSGFFGLLFLVQNFKEDFLQKAENQWLCGTHPFVMALEQVHKNVYEFVKHTQPQVEALERERDQMTSLLCKEQVCDGLKLLGCLIWLSPQKIFTVGNWFGTCSFLWDEKKHPAGKTSCMDPVFSIRSLYAEIGHFSKIKQDIKATPLDNAKEVYDKARMAPPQLSRSTCGS